MSCYFAYGSNMSSTRLTSRVGALRIVGVARLQGFQHRFNKRGNDGTAKGNVEVCADSSVVGVAYELEEAQLAILDAIEAGYRRDRLQVRLEAGGICEVLCYRAVLLGDGLEPTHSYLEHYVVGAAEHGISRQYLRAILPPWFSL